MAESRGINVLRADDGSLILYARLYDSAGAILTSGTTTLEIWHLVSGASHTLEGYDFDDDTFKTTVRTTPTVSLTHRTLDAGGTDTGLWSYRHATLTDFTVGDKYIVKISNSGASSDVMYHFQYGGAEGDQTGRDALLSVNLEGSDLRIEAALSEFGVVNTSTLTCQVVIYDESGTLTFTVSTSNFGSPSARGVFGYTWASHTLDTGHTYQFLITITTSDETFQTTKTVRMVSI